MPNHRVASSPIASSRFAAKTLTRVEVDSAASNQHELHAGKLRTLLGFGSDRVRGQFTVVVHTADDLEPNVDGDETFTLYDARENTPGRTEWRLYYGSPVVGKYASEGDLLVIYRASDASTDLVAVIARSGTRIEHSLRHGLAIGDDAALKRFMRVEPMPPAATPVAELVSLVTPERPAVGYRVEDHPLYVRAVHEGVMPTTREMAAAAYEIVASNAGAGTGLDPDTFLSAAIETESALFFAIERANGEQELRALLAAGSDFAQVLSFALSKHQARKSRRGYSLQNHIQALLDRHGIPYTSQCPTEPGEKPDFVIPGRSEYHDLEYPADRLRMVGCKSRVRERWRQYLTEAERIPLKYHVAVDEDLSDDLLRAMHKAELRLFMPRAIIEARYASRPVASMIRTLRDLIDELQSAATSSEE